MGNTCCGEAQKPIDVYEQQIADYENKKAAMLKNGAHQLTCTKTIFCFNLDLK